MAQPVCVYQRWHLEKSQVPKISPDGWQVGVGYCLSHCTGSGCQVSATCFPVCEEGEPKASIRHFIVLFLTVQSDAMPYYNASSLKYSYLLMFPWKEDQSGLLCGTKVKPPPYQSEVAFLGTGPHLAACLSARSHRRHFNTSLVTFILKDAGLQVDTFILLSRCSQTLPSVVTAESLALRDPPPFLQVRIRAAVSQRHPASKSSFLHLQTFTQQLVLNL